MSALRLLLSVLACRILGAYGLPIYTADYKVEPETRALLYLSRYGYIHYGGETENLLKPVARLQPLQSNSASPLARLTKRPSTNARAGFEHSNVLLDHAVAQFQEFSGLNVTGELDTKTLDLMKQPRCGVKDIIGFGSRFKRYTLQGSRWKTTDLTYHISKYPRTRRLTKEEVDREVAGSFQVWQDASNLTFTPSPLNGTDIEIRFERYEHGDGEDFDGNGGTLGHAFFPEFGGDIHLDDSEFWTIDMEIGTNLKFSLVHEMGHSLGLSHSDVPGAIMAPFYQDFKKDLALHADDLFGIRELYGSYGKKSRGRGHGGSLCADSYFDTIFTTADLNTYVFRREYYWKLEDYGISSDGYPRLIEDDWDGLEPSIDAAFTTEDDNMTYVLKGERVWTFHNQRMVSPGPSRISEEFPGIPNNVDAAFVWGGNGKIYFIKKDKYWKFDKERKPPVKKYFPISTKVWDLPPAIKAAMQWSNKKTYFFTTNHFYRFNDFAFEIAQDVPAYPRLTATWWFGCPA